MHFHICKYIEICKIVKKKQKTVEIWINLNMDHLFFVDVCIDIHGWNVLFEELESDTSHQLQLNWLFEHLIFAALPPRKICKYV